MSASAKFAVRWLCLARRAGAGHAGASPTTKKDKDKDKDAPAKPALVGSYGDWSVYQSRAARTASATRSPRPRSARPTISSATPATPSSPSGPAERVRNEVSFVMGFELGGAEAVKDAEGQEEVRCEGQEDRKEAENRDRQPDRDRRRRQFDLLPKGSDLWVKNPAEESQLIDEMRKGAQLKIQRRPRRRAVVTVDTYSLTGFSQAIDRALKDCPAS